jgi:hypothetical protein
MQVSRVEAMAVMRSWRRPRAAAELFADAFDADEDFAHDEKLKAVTGQKLKAKSGKRALAKAES